MDLKVGDLVAFKKYEDMNDRERSGISKKGFPKFGKVSHVHNEFKRFFVEAEPYAFSQESIDYIIGNSDIGDINVGDEVLIKVTIGEIRENSIWVSWVDKSNVVEILKRKEPEYFIVKESHYGMYIGTARELVSDKSKAKIYTSQNICNDDAKDMLLDAWEVLPYDA